MRQVTEQQAAERAERKAKLAQLIKEISGMTSLQRCEMFSRLPVVVNCEGRPLSVRNTILIHRQINAPTMVGGFRQWLKAGRCVKKGEHGAAILFPRTNGKAKDETPQDGETRVKSEGIRFLTGTVFDIAQTCAKDEADQETPEVSAPLKTWDDLDAAEQNKIRARMAEQHAERLALPAPVYVHASNVIEGDFQLV